MAVEFQRIPALHDTSPSSVIVDAAKGRQDMNWDWVNTRDDYCDRLTSILARWDEDASSYVEQIRAFRAPPHTVQRLAELLDDPSRWYTSPAKYCRALDRVLNVTFTTLDYSVEKVEFESTHHDSPLVPIPWLTRESVTESDAVRTPEAERTHENGTLAETVNEHAKVVTGSAPMDAADYGPQSQDVEVAIAAGATNGISTTKSDQDME